MVNFSGKVLVQGAASGEFLYTTEPLSFWGGVEQKTGAVIDHHHPLFGISIKGRILAIPSSRGSCTGSLVAIELLLGNCAPAGLVVREDEEIIATGVVVARTVLGLSIPVLRLTPQQFDSLASQKYASISESELWCNTKPIQLQEIPPPRPNIHKDIYLTEEDKAILNGGKGPAAAQAIEILIHYARIQNAHELITVTRAHIDACIYTGPASLLIPDQFLSQGARVVVPTTLNAISIDQRRWRELGVDEGLAKEADRLANIYVSMGAQNTFTCAPYLLDSPPQTGESIGWAESNAVVFANSVLGARTQKYPDLIDLCIALTGRAPLAGAQTDGGRVPTMCVDVTIQRLEVLEEVFWPLLGHVIGKIVGGGIPLITGLETVQPRPTMSDLKGFCAAFATTASAPMCHIAGITPEAAQFTCEGLENISCNEEILRTALLELTTATDDTVGLVSLGNPHFSLEEFEHLSRLCVGRHKASTTQMIITTNRQVYAQACAAGYVAIVEAFGVEILTDTCWCMIEESMIDTSVKNLMTNSAKYAHYAPGIVHRGVHFGPLRDCAFHYTTWELSFVHNNLPNSEIAFLTFHPPPISSAVHHFVITLRVLDDDISTKSKMAFLHLILTFILPLTYARNVPDGLRSFYDAVRDGGNCGGGDLLQGGFYDRDDVPANWGYCQRYMNGRGFYIKGPGPSLANMDIDCDGLFAIGDGRCGNSPDIRYETAFKDDVAEFGISDLNSYVHPYVVLGNTGNYHPTFDPTQHGVQPLSVVAVVCGDKLVYGVWGDVNGDDGLPLVGEASLALATECFGGDMNGDNGYDGDDVLYIAFTGDEAVPGDSANWKAGSFADFERSIEELGDELVEMFEDLEFGTNMELDL
ncbi:hypothetical protein BJX99DRAFT_262453 [Aspergillus californicus]